MNLLVLLAAVSILILVHEYGHFRVARLVGIKVEKFAIGFGKPIFKWVGKSGVTYVLAPILLGGYVKLNDKSYQEAHIAWRMLTMLAGVMANFIFAIIIFWLSLTIGAKVPKPMVGEVIKNSIAYQAGLKSGEEIKTVDGARTLDWQAISMAIAERMGDEGYLLLNDRKLDLKTWKLDPLEPNPLLSLGIVPFYPFVPPIIFQVLPDGPGAAMGLQNQDRVLKVNNKSITSWPQLLRQIGKYPQQKISLLIKRDRKYLKLTGIMGSKWQGLRKVGYLGVKPLTVAWPAHSVRFRRYALGEALLMAAKHAWDFTQFNFIIIGKIITGKISLRILGGPITIFTGAVQAFQQGIIVFMEFLGLISVMLAFINILPIPVLDGGNFVFLLIEAIIRRPIPAKIQLAAVRIGLLFLVTIIFFAIGNDIIRLFGD